MTRRQEAASGLMTPGVYINEQNAFPNSVVQVPTAIPAFIGYTARHSYEGKSFLNTPVLINSMQDYMAFFGMMVTAPSGGPPQAAQPGQQYKPVYFAVPVAPGDGDGDLMIGDTEYQLQPDPGTLYYLYNAVRLFFENGGHTAYVVSVGTSDGPPTAKPATATPVVNPHVLLNDLEAGLAALENEPEPTMLVIPDAMLLPTADNETLIELMLEQCGTMKSRIAVLDVPGGQKPDPELYIEDITAFRSATGEDFQSYGVAYYPYIETTIVQDPDISFQNIGGGASALQKLLPRAAADPLKSMLAKAASASNPSQVVQTENALRITSREYSRLHTALLAKINTLPPSGAMAGIYWLVDHTQGVWKAPANVGIIGATAPTINLTSHQQENLNVDASTGKSINAIRFFQGKGVLVWGARTLDGNSLDWRYVHVRRTMIMIEQSAKRALEEFVFEANDEATWATVTSMMTSFLTNLWKEGALAGASPAAAFSVSVGLGKTMTATDILNGIMTLVIKVAITHPVEFIVITISQKMQTS